MSIRAYASAIAFKQALEQRLREAAHEGGGLVRRRQLVVFDRFMARLSVEFSSSVVLKGGLVLELRIQRARTTRDIDLRFSGDPVSLLPRLQAAARRGMNDFMAFEVVPDPAHPDITNEGMPYGGKRFRASCFIAGKPYGNPFSVDVSIGESMFGTPDRMTARDVLGFAGVAPPSFLMIPVVAHVAEKFHAYTMPRQRLNSRVKDLPDIALLAGVGSLAARELLLALQQTFRARGTHDMPTRFSMPPEQWEAVYAAMADEDDLSWKTLAEVFSAARDFLEPVLLGNASGVWSPASWSWGS